MHRLARVAAILIVAASLPALHAPQASADGGCGTPGRPACTVLRPDEVAAVPAAPFGAGDCVVLVGGFASTAESTELAFEPLLSGADGVTVTTVRYDSLGRVAAAARALREHIDGISGSCGAIHLLAHSMGGVVADRAFSMGLSERERIATYLPFASPHNGSTMARALCGIGEVDAPHVEVLRKTAELLGQPDPSSAAICDLARARASRQPRGVETARLRLVTDPLVPQRDHAAPYRDVRELLPERLDQTEGHGGILRNGYARRVVGRALEEHAVPPDDRGVAHQALGRIAGEAADGPVVQAQRAVAGAIRAAAVIVDVAAGIVGLLRR